ncbi:Integrase catalytic domain-containing protein [Durusdinium trenchii]
MQNGMTFKIYLMIYTWLEMSKPTPDISLLMNLMENMNLHQEMKLWYLKAPHLFNRHYDTLQINLMACLDASDLALHETVVQRPCVQDLLDANGVLRRAQNSSDQRITYRWNMFVFEQAQILSITDASHAADYDVSASGHKLGLRSQSGRILALAGPSFWKDGGNHIALLSWKSTVLRRVCRSTLQAESLSMLAGYEEAEHVRLVLHGLTHEHKANDPSWEIEAKDAVTVMKMTDCRSLSDRLTQCGLGEVNDKRLAIDLSGMCQMIWRHKGQDYGDPLFEDKPPEDATTLVKRTC